MSTAPIDAKSGVQTANTTTTPVKAQSNNNKKNASIWLDKSFMNKPDYMWTAKEWKAWEKIAEASEICVDDRPAQTPSSGGFWSRAWSGIKNFFGFGSSSTPQPEPIVVQTNDKTGYNYNQLGTQRKGFWGRTWDRIKNFFGASNDNGYAPVKVNNYENKSQTGGWWSRLCNRMNKFYEGVNAFSRQPFTMIKQWCMGKPEPGQKITFTGSSTESIGNAILKIAAYPLVAPIAIGGAAVEALNPTWKYIKQETQD